MLIALLIVAAAVWVGLAVTLAVALGRGIGIADTDRHTAIFATAPVRRMRVPARRTHRTNAA